MVLWSEWRTDNVAILNLDTLKCPPIEVTLGGKTHKLAVPDIETIGKVGDLGKRLKASSESGDPAASSLLLREILGLIAPSLPALEPEQANAVIGHWNDAATADREAVEADAKEVAGNPTLPR